MYLHPFIKIDETKFKGRGVFAVEALEISTLIEVSPVIVIDPKETKMIHKTVLHDYYFSWGEDQKSSAIAMGYVSIYNHKIDPNCEYEADFASNTIQIITRKAIAKGEELTINYNLDALSENKLWFDPK